jgi:hypothetical protein
LNKILTTLAFTILLGPLATAVAQQSVGQFGVDLDSKTLSVQAKAEELFERGDYRRVHIIYLNDLAPIGDKYAQYMLGFMSLGGLGVEPDAALASAWFRLAAERGKPPEFVRIRDELLLHLDDSDRARSETIFMELRRSYSDIAISMREVREAHDELAGIGTGSRLGASSSSPMMILEPRARSSLSRDALIHRVQQRVQEHLDNITAELGMQRIPAETLDAGELEDLEVRVEDHLRRTDER